jgi:hypothetical protein
MSNAFGESLSFDAQKKVTKEKGRQTPSLRGLYSQVFSCFLALMSCFAVAKPAHNSLYY